MSSLPSLRLPESFDGRSGSINSLATPLTISTTPSTSGRVSVSGKLSSHIKGSKSSSRQTVTTSTGPPTPFLSTVKKPIVKVDEEEGFTNSAPDLSAGVPVLELVRKLEEEKILNREDRQALNEALYNQSRREKILVALRDVELGDNQRFAIRRLKALIHQNAAGALSSKVVNNLNSNNNSEANLAISSANNNTNNPDENREDSATVVTIPSKPVITDPLLQIPAPRPRQYIDKNRTSNENDAASIGNNTVEVSVAVSQVVGNEPLYVSPEGFGVCSKIQKRLQDFMKAYKPSMGRRKFAVIVGTGSCNPLTRMHMRSYFLAKQHLEQVGGFVVLGSLLSCAHSSTVRERYRFHPSEIIPSPHRLAIAQLLVQESKWLSIEPWEITRRRAMDYLSLLDHTAETLQEHFNGIEFSIIYLCKGNMIPKISPQAIRNGNYGVICVCRPPESDQIKASLSAKWNGIMHVAEDTAILDNNMDVVSSRKVRDKIKNNENISQYLGDSVQTYIRAHRLDAKMKGEELWTDEERKLPKISSRPYEFTFEHTLRSQALSENNKMIDGMVVPGDNDDITINSTMSDITFR